MSALPSSSAASAPCNHSTDTAACGQKNREGASTVASPVAAAGVCVDSDFPSSHRGNLKSYFDSLFSGDLCCKLWFTTPRSSSRKLLSRLTDLLRAAAGEQRKNLNCHIPTDVLRSLAGHTREKVCLANHKAFWPYPPTLMHLFNDLEVYAGAQCMGDMVVQNSSQLHWGVNIAGGIKAESSNCAGKDFWRFCSECSDGLFCGPETDLLQHVFHTARKEYWASRRVKNWRKKKGLCWGYHGCGCIRPRALGLEEAEREMEGEEMPAETGRQGGRASGGERKRKRGHTNDNNGNTNSNNDNDVSCAATACSEAFKGAKKKNEEFIISKKRAKKKKGWGRPFDWVDLFKSLKVNLCWEEWERLKWLTCTDQTNTANAMQTNEREIRTNEEDKRDSSEQQQQQLLLPPPSLHALLEENYELQRGSGGTEEQQTKGEVDSHDKEKTTKNQGDNTQRKRPANDHEDEKRQWEVDGNVSCIRFVRSVSPQLLRIMPACTHIDISSPPLRRNKRNNTLQTEGGGDASAATDEPKDERQARECAPVPPGEDNSPSSSPFFSADAAAPAGGGGSGDECEQIATVEFQRMWPVFVRVGEESRLPVSASAGEEGVVLFLGCLLEVFHMRIQTEKELALCLKGIADAATADLNTAPESDRPHEGFERQANSKKDKSNNGSNSNSSSKNNKSNNKNNGSSNNTSNNNNVSSNNTCRSPTSSAPTPLGLPEQFVEASTQATDNSSQTVNDLQEARRLPLASCGDDNHKDGRGDATTLIRKRLIPPILFEPAPRRPQRLSAPPSSGGAAAVEDAELVSAATAVTRVRHHSAVASVVRVSEREVAEECTVSHSKNNLPSSSVAPSAPCGENNIISCNDEVHPVRGEPADCPKGEQCSRQGNMVEILQLRGGDEPHEIREWDSHGVGKTSNISYLKRRQNTRSDKTDAEFASLKPVPPSVQSYDGHHRRRLEGTEILQAGQTATASDFNPFCNGSSRLKAHNIGRGDLQCSGYKVQPWTEQSYGHQVSMKYSSFSKNTGSPSGPLSQTHAAQMRMGGLQNGNGSLFASFGEGGLSHGAIYQQPLHSPPPLFHMPYAPPCPVNQPPPPPLRRIPYAPPQEISCTHNAASCGDFKRHWQVISGPNTADASVVPPGRALCPAVSRLSRPHRKWQDSSSTGLAYQSTCELIPSSALCVGPFAAHRDTALSVAAQGSCPPVHHPKYADERAEAIKCKNLLLPDSLSEPSHEKGHVVRGGAAFTASRAWKHSGNGRSGAIFQPSEAPSHNNENQGFKSQARILADSCSAVSRHSKATTCQMVQDGSQSNRDTAHISKTSKALAGRKQLCDMHADMQTEYKLYLKQRLEAVIRGVWSWRSESVNDFSQHHDQPFSVIVAQNAIRNGFTPYILMHYASTTGVEERLKPLDMSVGGKRNIPFHGFPPELVDSLCSGIGHGMMYYSVVPGSVFPIHCEQGGLGAFNLIVGALVSYTEQLCP